MLKKLSHIALVAFVGVALAACGPTEDRPHATNGDDVQTITITPVGDEMRFEQTEFTVRPGQQVRLIMENTATSPAMHHNVVIVEDQAAVERVGPAALEAGPEADYIPEDGSIIAYTPMAAPGETTEVTFTAPDAEGDYPYLCTYPGHWALMQGVMHVRN
jgi:azurin